MSGAADIFDKVPAALAAAGQPLSGMRLQKTRRRNWPVALAGVVVCAVVLLAPLPLASNTPLAWLAWAIVLGCTGGVISIGANRSEFTIPHFARIPLVLGMAFAGFAVFQALPLPMIQGGVSVNFPSGPVLLRTLSIAPGATFVAALRTTSYIIFFWLALQAASDPHRAKRIGTVLYFGISVHAIAAVLALQVFSDVNFMTEKQAYFGMATGTFVNKNSFATFLGMGAMIGLARVLGAGFLRQPKAARALQIAALGAILLALFLTQSRMGLAATTIAGAVVTFRLRGALRAAILLGTAATLIVLASAGLGLFAGFFDLQSSGSTRIEFYAQQVRMLQARPLTGFGLNSFALAYELFHAPPVTAGFVWDRAHSTYLTLWIEGGLVMGSLPLIAGGLVMRGLWQRSGRALPGQTMALAGLAAMVLAALHSLIDFSLEIQANTFLLLALVALGLGPRQSLQENH